VREIEQETPGAKIWAGNFQVREIERETHAAKIWAGKF